jgi:hypothetical protein
LIPHQEGASLTDMQHLHRRRLIRRAFLTVAISIAVPSTGAAQGPAVVWATDSTAPCVGITVSINTDAAKMQAFVGPRWRVVPSKDGTASTSLFITKCPTSTIGNRRIGTATIAAVILAVESRADAPGGARAPVVPLVFGDSAAPVPELFRAHAFAVRSASVTLDVDSAASPRRVTFSVTTKAGRIDGSATPSDSSAIRSLDSRLSATDPARASEFTGPEWMHRSQASATVRATGTTLFSELGVVTMPTTALYDVGFGWRFAFQLK